MKTLHTKVFYYRVESKIISGGASIAKSLNVLNEHCCLESSVCQLSRSRVANKARWADIKTLATFQLQVDNG